MTDANAITLGGKDYPIASLTMGQMRTVAPAFVNMTTQTPAGMAAMISVIHGGMSAADPTMTVEKIDAIKGVTLTELNLAVAKISALMGITAPAKKGVASGEAEAPGTAPEQGSTS